MKTEEQKQKARERSKRYYRTNRDIIRNKARAFAEQNPERVKQYRDNYRKRLPPWRELLVYAKTRAQNKELPFDLTKSWAEQRWTGFCELTGLPFESQILTGCQGPMSPSIDRVNQSKGYTQNNCRFVLLAVNQLRGVGDDEQMYEVAEALLRNKQ